jgi:hypothetical protein
MEVSMRQSLYGEFKERRKMMRASACRMALACGALSAALLAGALVWMASSVYGQTAQPAAAHEPQQKPPVQPESGKAVNDAASLPPAAGAQDNGPEAKRRKEMSEESAELLSLAIALKAEVSKTNKDMLSLGVIRRADEIERLAKSMRRNLKQ